MLVLSRKVDERIVIDDRIVVTVVKIDRNHVRLGIEAPGNVPVFREEILPEGHPLTLKGKNRAATAPSC